MSVHEIFKLIKSHRRKHAKTHAIVCTGQPIWICVVIVIEFLIAKPLEIYAAMKSVNSYNRNTL